MNIEVRVVPNGELNIRAGFTGADWWWNPDGSLQVRIAKEIDDADEIACLILHEVSEALFCRKLGISHQEVDLFDKEYQRTHEVDLNAGDEPDSPYRVPHNWATAIERIAAGVLDVKWKGYDEKLSKI